VVVTASDGPSAIRRVKATVPDVLVLDLNLPGVHGVEVCATAGGRRGADPHPHPLGEWRTPGRARRGQGGRFGVFVQSAEREAFAPRAQQLTERQTEVLKLVATGMGYKEIAAQLFISHRTAQNHVQNTLGTLQMHHRVELVRYALAQGPHRD